MNHETFYRFMALAFARRKNEKYMNSFSKSEKKRKPDSIRSKTDRAAMGKYDRTQEQDMEIVRRVHRLAEKYGVKMQQIALAWEWEKGVTAPVSYTHLTLPTKLEV